MKFLHIDYSHEFISNKIKDELILSDIWDFSSIEKAIIRDVYDILNFKIGQGRDINTLSGGQRSITYLVTLSYILKEKKVCGITLSLNNIIESLSQNTAEKIIGYLEAREIYVA